MSTRNTIHQPRLTLALTTAALVGVLATGALAAQYDYSRERRSDQDRRDTRTRDSETIRPTPRNDNPAIERDRKNAEKARKKLKILNGGRVTSDNDRDRDHRSSNGYRPPTYRGGRYYYDSRPNSKPMHYGHWVFQNHNSTPSRRSIYYHFGNFPYLRSSRVYTRPYTTIGYINRPTRYYTDGYYLARRDNTPLWDAMSDIRNAWLNGRSDLIRKHVERNRMIAVLLDGRYDYSLEGSDYNDMTDDAIDEIRTVSFTWKETRERTNGDYTAFGTHIYRDDYNATKVVYVSYTLRRAGHGYTIVEVGSSNSQLY